MVSLSVFSGTKCGVDGGLSLGAARGLSIMHLHQLGIIGECRICLCANHILVEGKDACGNVGRSSKRERHHDQRDQQSLQPPMHVWRIILQQMQSKSGSLYRRVGAFPFM